MDNTEKKRLLNILLEESEKITDINLEEPEFCVWRKHVSRTLERIYGKSSREATSIPLFIIPTRNCWNENDIAREHTQKDFQELKLLIQSYIKDIDLGIDRDKENQNKDLDTKSKVFISHSSKDADIVEEIVELLEVIGLSNREIFCTSFEGYGLNLGDNFLEKIKENLSSKNLVLFILTENFFNSPVCMCEMGATWILSQEHIPILIPPLDYSDIKGVISSTQGFKINEILKINSLKEMIEDKFNLEKRPENIWERKRDKIVERIINFIEINNSQQKA
jgi:hypothetical protein